MSERSARRATQRDFAVVFRRLGIRHGTALAVNVHAVVLGLPEDTSVRERAYRAVEICRNPDPFLEKRLRRFVAEDWDQWSLEELRARARTVVTGT